MASGGREARPNWLQRAVHSGTGQAIRWGAVLGLVLWRWAAGVPSGFSGWLPILIIGVLLLLPDAESVAFGGVTLEMRRTREEITGLRQQVMQLQVAQARAAAIGALNLTTENPEVAQVVAAAVRLTAQTAASEGTRIEPYQPGAS
jgi:hypothetical protein